MHPSPCGDMTIMVEPEPAQHASDRVGGGMVLSLLLHVVAVVLVVLVLPHLFLAPSTEMLVPIDLVQLGDRNTAPPSPDKAAVPQEQARETATETPAEPVPLAAPPPPPPETKPADAPEEVTAGRRPVVAPEVKPASPKAKTPTKSDRPAVPVPQPKAPPVDDLAARLQSLSRQQQQQARLPSNPRQRDGTGASNVTASSDNAAPGREAVYDVRDFIRVQIARHWRPDVASLGAGDFVVAIHLALNRDGSVASAEIVDDPRRPDSEAYHSLARSARNAALLASPLTVPAGRYDAVRDITISLSARDALR
jgi:outer membrane biosynthesis protein TonB